MMVPTEVLAEQQPRALAPLAARLGLGIALAHGGDAGRRARGDPARRGRADGSAHRRDAGAARRRPSSCRASAW